MTLSSDPILEKEASKHIQSPRERVLALYATLKSAVFSGSVDATILSQTDELTELVDRGLLLTEGVTCALHYRALALACYIYYHFDRREQARFYARTAPDGLAEMSKNIKTWVNTQPALIKAISLFALEYAHTELSRPFKYKDAINAIQACQSAIERIVSEAAKCHATLGLSFYYLGHAWRGLNDYGQAERAFQESLRNYRRHAIIFKNWSDSKGDIDPVDFADYRSAVCQARGLGWLNLSRGRVSDASYNLHHARLSLVKRNDPINEAYVGLIDGEILRSSGRFPEAKIAFLEARANFDQNGHRFGRSRCDYGLAKVHFETDDYSKALELANGIQSSEDSRWRGRVGVLLSRIHRQLNNLELSLKLAGESGALAQSVSDVRGELDARIAMAETEMLLGRFGSARGHLNYVLAKQNDLAENDSPTGTPRRANAKTTASCELALAACCLHQRDLVGAKDHFANWRELRGEVEHNFLHRRAAEISAEIEKSEVNFVIGLGPDQSTWKNALNYANHHENLKRWLLARALEVNNTTSDAAKSLGISRDACHRWMQSYRFSSRRSASKDSTDQTNGI